MAGKSIDHAFTATGNLGAASDPTYAGVPSFLRRRFTKDVSGTDAAVWGIPFDSAVSNRPGARFGPAAIRRASMIFDNDPQYPFGIDLFERMGVVDYGETACSIIACRKPRMRRSAQRLRRLWRRPVFF